MITKDESVAAPEQTPAGTRPKRLVPDYSKRAKDYLEGKIVSTFGVSSAPEGETVPDHATAENLRIASVLEIQRNQGNYYVQRAIDAFHKRTHAAQPPAADANALADKKQALAQNPQPAAKLPPAQGDEKKSEPPPAGKKVDTTVVAADTKHPAVDKAEKTIPEVPEAKQSASVEPAPLAKTLPGGSSHPASKAGTSSTPAAGGATDPIAHWRSKVRHGVGAMKPPQLKGPGTSTVRNAGDQAIAKHNAVAKSLPEEAKKVVPPPKEPQGLPPVPDDLSRDAIALLDKKTGRKLDPQSLPDLVEKSPLGHIPIIGKEFKPLVDPVKVEAPPDKKDGVDPVKTETGKKGAGAADKKKPAEPAPPTDEEKEKQKDEEKKKLSRTGETVKDEQPPEIKLPDARPVDIGAVVASLLIDEQKYATQIVTQAKAEAFRGAPATATDSFGTTLEKEELPVVDGELRRLAEAAGIEKEALEKKVQDRRKELTGQNQKVADDQSAAVQEARKKEEDASKTSIQLINDLRTSMEKSAMARAQSVKGSADADQIRADRERLIEGVNRKYGDSKVNYDSARKKLKEGLDAAAGRQAKAYEVAALEDEAQLQKDADTDDKKKAAREAYRPTKYWLDEQKRALAKAVEIRKVAIDDQADPFVKELTDAADDAREKIRENAARRLGYERGFFQRLFDWISDWQQQSKIQTDAWARKRSEENKAAVEKDSAFLDTELVRLSKMTEAEIQIEVKHLDDEQFAVINAFFASKGQDRVGAIAAGLITRIINQQRPELVKKLDAEVLACDKFEPVDAVTVAMNEDFKAQAKIKADRLHDAFAGWGTNESLVFQTLAGMTALEAHDVELAYKERHGENLRDRLKSELDDWATTTSHDIDRANAMMAGDDSLAVAVELDDAMHGTMLGTGIGTDEDTIFKALRNRSPAQIAAIKKAYREKYGKDLEGQLKGELNDWFVRGTHDVDRMSALMTSDVVTADTVAIDQAMHGGWLGLGIGTDRKAIEGVYEQQMAELEQDAAARGWSSIKLKEEKANRLKELDTAYTKKYGKDFVAEKPGQTALGAAYEDELSGPELRLIQGMHENDLAKVTGARINIEHNSFLYADDKIINKAMREQYLVPFEDIKRDLNLAINEEMQADKKRLLPEAFAMKWKPEETRRRRKEAEKKAEEDAKPEAAKNFDKLENEYDTQYKGRVSVMSALAGTPSLGLRADVMHDTQFTENKKAGTLIKQSGYLSDIQEERYAVQGAGTDDDAARHAFKGKNKAEMNDFRERWAQDPENKKEGITETLDDFVLGDFSGRDKQEMRGDLEYGEAPDDPKDQLAKMEDLARFEHKGSIASDLFGLGKDELALIDKDVADLKKSVDALNNLNKDDKDYWQKYAQMKGDVDSQVTIVESSVAAHRTTVDVVADTAAEVIGAVVTAVIIVVSIVADVATVGGATAATPAEAALISGIWTALGISLAGTALTMGAKFAIKGSSVYGAEDIGEDAAIGLVDALMSIIPGGKAANFLKGSKTLMKMAERKGLAKLVAKFMAHAAEGAIQATPGAILGNAMNKSNTKDGISILDILEGAAVQVGGAALLSGGIGTFHGTIKDNMLTRARADIEFQDRVFRKYSAKNPGKTRLDFLGQLDHLIATETTNGFRDPKLQEQLRTRVLEHIPPGQRALLKDVPVRVLPDAEFKALTRSDSGNAVTVFQDGKATVIVKAGTDLSHLGEEGIHLLQAHEPAWSAKVKKLEESNLKHWDQLDLDTQLDLYKTKLELEIDANQRVGKALEEQKARGGKSDQLADQIEKNKATLENLKKRQMEVAAITPEDKLNMQPGAKGKPQYLDQPARLFAKDTTIPKPAEIAEAKLRPIDEVRNEHDAIKQAESKGPLTADQRGRLNTLEQELKTQYAPQKGETLPEMEKRLLAQKPGETLGEYRERLEKLAPELERGGNVELFLRYEDLLGEVANDAEKAAGLRSRLDEATRARSELERYSKRPWEADPRISPSAKRQRSYELVREMTDLFSELKIIESRYKRQPWKDVSLADPDTTRVGLRGELEMTESIQKNARAEAIGKTVRPERIVTPSDFDTAHHGYKGQTGIDGLYARPNPEKPSSKQFAAAESKATGDPRQGAPIGKGALETTMGGADQLSDNWLLSNLDKQGLSAAEEKQFVQDLKAHKVLKVYAQTTPKGTRYFEVIDDGLNEVHIGAEITSWEEAFRRRSGASH